MPWQTASRAYLGRRQLRDAAAGSRRASSSHAFLPQLIAAGLCHHGPSADTVLSGWSREKAPQPARKGRACTGTAAGDAAFPLL